MGLICDIVARIANDGWGLAVTGAQLRQLERYAELLVEWNATRMNLTRIVEPEEIAVKHFADSLSVLTAVAVPLGIPLIDVGTGAGMPGIPLKIVRPDLRVTLLDSTAKKLTFCRAVIDDLGLEGIETIHGRAEEVSRQPGREQAYGIATARAVASLDKLIPWCAPFVETGGLIIALKGPAVVDEIAPARPIAHKFGVVINPPKDVTIPGETEPGGRKIVVGWVGRRQAS
jgi:16S rRNA (guanine527-N7)-methyltransferase